MTPISSIDENSSPNQRFTLLNSFENNVLGITLIVFNNSVPACFFLCGNSINREKESLNTAQDILAARMALKARR
jgi:hypothetical protein